MRASGSSEHDKYAGQVNPTRKHEGEAIENRLVEGNIRVEESGERLDDFS